MESECKTDKRKRTKNFNETEKWSSFLGQKKETWEKLAKEFNLSTGTQREADILKTKYLNLKKKSKEKFSANKKGITLTGGGPYIPIEFSTAELGIMEIVGPEITGLTNSYDNDAEQTSITIIAEDNMKEDMPDPEMEANLNQIIDEPSTSTHDWVSYTPTNLKVYKSKELRKTRLEKKTYIPAEKKLVDEKICFLKAQKAMFAKEHEIKMEIMKLELQIKEKELEKLQKY
ncbi:unnamed protein product [Brassicogethes aeneus]|uniref:Regulatory protein zeste n=1 Tax=Brassicogethes aeneus TaxID=1431903 RepID=A0A9P0B538_BRAAE|nr:unnamed protein product [Brassicogethes aeneus]